MIPAMLWENFQSREKEIKSKIICPSCYENRHDSLKIWSSEKAPNARKRIENYVKSESVILCIYRMYVIN